MIHCKSAFREHGIRGSDFAMEGRHTHTHIHSHMCFCGPSLIRDTPQKNTGNKKRRLKSRPIFYTPFLYDRLPWRSVIYLNARDLFTFFTRLHFRPST